MSYQPTRWTFGTVEWMLAERHAIAPARRTAFQARLKNFHRLGYPFGFQTTKGKAAIYGPGEFISMALAIEMTQLGLPPERVVQVLDEYWIWVAAAIEGAASDLEKSVSLEKPNHDTIFVLFDPHALGSLSENKADSSHTPFLTCDAIHLNHNLASMTSGSLNRVSVINLTGLLDQSLKSHISANVDRNGEDEIKKWRKGFYYELSKWGRSSVEQRLPKLIDCIDREFVDTPHLSSAQVNDLSSRLQIEFLVPFDTISRMIKDRNGDGEAVTWQQLKDAHGSLAKANAGRPGGSATSIKAARRGRDSST